MSLWAEYIKECGLLEIIEEDWGWITFHADPNGCLWINDIYVCPDKRDSGQGHGKKLLERALSWGRARGSTHATATVNLRSKTATEALAASIACGFRIAPSGTTDLVLLGMLL